MKIKYKITNIKKPVFFLEIGETVIVDYDEGRVYSEDKTQYIPLSTALKFDLDGEQLQDTVIKVKYVRDVEPIKLLECGDWIDLRAAEDVELKAGEYRMIPLGVAMELPKGYEALMLPRSSTFKKYGVILANSMGVIDESYCGDSDEWNFLAYALVDTKIPKNERICQFRIMEHQPPVTMVEVETLGNKNRGGIGSTGRL